MLVPDLHCSDQPEHKVDVHRVLFSEPKGRCIVTVVIAE